MTLHLHSHVSDPKPPSQASLVKPLSAEFYACKAVTMPFLKDAEMSLPQHTQYPPYVHVGLLKVNHTINSHAQNTCTFTENTHIPLQKIKINVFISKCAFLHMYIKRSESVQDKQNTLTVTLGTHSVVDMNLFDRNDTLVP